MQNNTTTLKIKVITWLRKAAKNEERLNHAKRSNYDLCRFAMDNKKIEETKTKQGR